jgi:hypothetical protein
MWVEFQRVDKGKGGERIKRCVEWIKIQDKKYYSCRQVAFMENYFESQRDQIFRNVEVCATHGPRPLVPSFYKTQPSPPSLYASDAAPSLPTSFPHFSPVQVLIYVFDIESLEPKRDLETFKNCVDAVSQVSKVCLCDVL